MRFTLLVQSHPTSAAGPGLALRFARAALGAGHSVRQVFFYADAATVLSRPQVASDECDLDHEWQRIAQTHGTALLACSTAALRRGVAPMPGVFSTVAAGSLAQFLLGLEQSDRLLSFVD